MDEKDNTHASMMDKVEQLTNEKYSLEDTLSSLRSQLAEIEKENLRLKSKVDDMQKSLDMEKMRFNWQQIFYEKYIQQLSGLAVKSACVTEGNASYEDVAQLRKAGSMEDLLENNAIFYEDTIQALVAVQETKNDELDEIKKSCDEKLIALNLKHEAVISEILESSNAQVQKLIEENERLVHDMLAGCEGLFDDLKTEYGDKVRANPEMDTQSGLNILVQFNGLSTSMKGIVVSGIAVISVVTVGLVNWGFISYVWSLLIKFAEMVVANPQTSFQYLMDFINCAAFQSFLNSWKEGKSLTECLKSFVKVEILMTVLRMAPTFISHLKNFNAAVM